MSSSFLSHKERNNGPPVVAAYVMRTLCTCTEALDVQNPFHNVFDLNDIIVYSMMHFGLSSIICSCNQPHSTQDLKKWSLKDPADSIDLTKQIEMSKRQHSGPLPTSEDVQNLLEAAQRAAESLYHDQTHPYLSDGLRRMFANSLKWLNNGMDPCEILVETIYDERTILDRHNRLQAKALYRQEDVRALSEELHNFPLRYLCINRKNISLPAGFPEPIFQLDDYPKIEAAARQARESAAIDGPQSDGSISPSPSDSSNRPSNKNAGLRLGKVRDTASPEHDFPDANFTLAEIAAFLPQCIKSWDVADRILWNGAGQEDLQKMMNKYRVMPFGEIEINSVYMMMRGQMRKRTVAEHGYKYWKTWVVGDQQDVQKPADYDAGSISVTGFRRAGIFKGRFSAAAKPIPFKHLAHGISLWPDGDDALDLTRCVAWCVENSDEDYCYPTDYSKVLARIGGPLNPHARHSDAAALKRLRFGTGRTQRRTRAMHDRNHDSTDSVGAGSNIEPSKRKHDGSSSNTRIKRARNSASEPTRKVRSVRTSGSRSNPRIFSSHPSTNESEDDTEDEQYRGPKRVKKNTDGPRRSGRKHQPVSYVVDAEELDDIEADYAYEEGTKEYVEETGKGEEGGRKTVDGMDGDE